MGGGNYRPDETLLIVERNWPAYLTKAIRNERIVMAWGLGGFFLTVCIHYYMNPERIGFSFAQLSSVRLQLPTQELSIRYASAANGEVCSAFSRHPLHFCCCGDIPASCRAIRPAAACRDSTDR